MTLVTLLHLVYKLKGDGPDSRMEFCQTMLNRFNDNQNFINQIPFTNNVTFYLHRINTTASTGYMKIIMG